MWEGGSSRQNVFYRARRNAKAVPMEAVSGNRKGKMTVIAHGLQQYGGQLWQASERPRHAESLGVDAAASIPPIYFHLPEHAIAQY